MPTPTPLPLLLLVILVLAALLQCAHASVWDPHPIPPTPPFFEGWYLRATLFDATTTNAPTHNNTTTAAPADTIAVLFAAAQLPAPTDDGAPLPAAYVAILHGDSQAGRTFVYEATPPVSSVQVLRHGQNVTTPPDWRTPPAFTWRAEGGGGSVMCVVEGKHMMLRVEAGGEEEEARRARLWVEVEVKDWQYDGGVARPHSWTDVSESAKLHYYIHTLASPITYLRLELPPSSSPSPTSPTATTRVLESATATGAGAVGLAHLEKNWGSRFPHAWLWAQGSTRVGTRDDAAVSFIFSHGAVSPDPEGPFTHFGHFRDEKMELAWDFKPDNSFLTRTEVDSCGGVARFVLHGFDPAVTLEDGSTHRPKRRLALDFQRPAGTAACLLGPTGQGFERLCEETFQATARVTATLDGRLLREITIDRIALELGAGLLCNGTCSGSGPTQQNGGGVVVTTTRVG